MTIDELVEGIRQLINTLAEKKKELDDITRQIDEFENASKDEKYDEDYILWLMERQEELQPEIQSMQNTIDELQQG